MIFVVLLILACSFLLTYKKLNHSSTRFMYGIIVGWVMSWVAFALYLSKFNYYYNIIHTMFDFSPGTWNYLVLTKFNPKLLIRLLNGGVILFHCSLLCFAVSFTRSLKPKVQRAAYAATAGLFAAQLVLYDPSIHILWQNDMSYHSVFTVVDISLKIANYAMVALSFGLLLNYYANYPKIKFIKNLTLFHILGLIPITGLHLLLFSWAPQNLVKPTYLEGYYNYLQPPFGSQPFVLLVLPYAIYGALTLMIFIIYKFNSIEIYRKNRDIQINKSIDTATLGARAFTHALKNHLIAIRSEAEYLQELHAGHEETAYSLSLMRDSCNAALGSINDAADKLKHIQLNLQPLSLELPVEKALSQMGREQPVDIRLNSARVQTLSYIDLNHLSETICNLLKNAAESLSKTKNGLIEIETGEQNGWGMIRISDNGPGISEEYLDMIFDPFFTTKSSINNWGIGLSYCHKIVAAHDGKIQVESELGRGTAFTIYLPLI